MSIETHLEIVVTNDERELAREAMVRGHRNCAARPFHARSGVGYCACDMGAIDGCRARVEAIAMAIASSRRS